MFDALGSFDKPFNQAPSLHVSLTVVMWARFSAHLRGAPLWMVRLWLAMAALSTLTTYQHHFIDLPTGFAAGLIAIGLFPSGTRARLSSCFATGALLLAASALWIGGIALVLLWPAAALSIVSIAYWTGRAKVYGKRGGALHPLMLALLAPYVAGAWINSRWSTRRDPAAQEIAGGVWIGRLARRRDLAAFGIASVVDLTAELPIRYGGVSYCNVPMLDLAVPTVAQLDDAVDAIDGFAGLRPTLVCCALGYSRSAAAVVAWLVRAGHAGSVDEALAMLRGRRRRVALSAAHEDRLREWAGR
jgi:protein-tyrosine phosphatase